MHPEYSLTPRRRRRHRWWLWLALVLLALLAAGVIAVRQYYHTNLRPVSASQQVRYVTVESGTAASDIAVQLQSSGLIRNSQVFEWYINSKELRSKLQAGTYALRPSMTVPEIVAIMSEGKVATDTITIIPGQPIDQVQAAFVKAGFNENEVKTAFDPAQYPENPALADKPAGASLEGFLYPETFQKSKTTKPADIVKQSLDLMAAKLTPDVRASYARNGLSVFQAITLGSIVEQEVGQPSDRAQAAQVFLKRLRTNIPLGSDVTALYGARLAGQRPTITFASPYNTATNHGLPPGPISNVSESSILAIAHPADTDWLYFVSGDSGTTYFSKTLEEHEALTAKYCTKLCSGAD